MNNDERYKITRKQIIKVKKMKSYRNKIEIVTPRPEKRVDTWQPPLVLEWDPVSQAAFKESQGKMISIHYELKIPTKITFNYSELLPKFRQHPVYNTKIPLPKENNS